MDTLFGAEEEFEYTSTTTAPTSTNSAPSPTTTPAGAETGGNSGAAE